MSLLTADDLLHGAFYALEHGGRLLQDAVGLWERGSYSSAVVLAVFAREELGRYKILLAEREEAKRTGPRDAVGVQKRCRDHEDKLQRGMFGFGYTFDAHNDPELMGLYSEPGSDAYNRSEAILNVRMAYAAKRDPHETHEARMRALYVDVDSQGNWNRPAGLSAEESGAIVSAVASYYAPIVGHLTMANIGDPWDELRLSLERWPDAPTLPPVARPDLIGYEKRARAPAG